MNKSDTVRELVVSGNFKRALNIAKGFKLGDKEDLGKMALAYSCLVHTGFYTEIGTDTEKAVDEGVAVLKKLYGT